MLLLFGCAQRGVVQFRDTAMPIDELEQRTTGAAPPIQPVSLSRQTAQADVAELARNFEKRDDRPMDLRQALELALRNSNVVRVSSGSSVEASPDTYFDVEIAAERVKAAKSRFDPRLESTLYGTQIKEPPDSFFGPGLSEPNARDEGAFNVGIVKPLATGGEAEIKFDPDPGYLFIPQNGGSGFNPTHVGELEIGVRQPVLRGRGLAVNRAPIRISQIRSEESAWEFKKAVMESVRSVADAYWELYAARVALEAIDEVIPLLEEIVHLQEQAFQAEWAIAADVAKAKAQLYDYREQRLELQSDVVSSELRLRDLIGLPPADGFKIVPVTAPIRAVPNVDVQHALGQAVANQPDLVRQRLDVGIRELELLVAKNGRMPRFDIEALYRMNGVGQDVGNALQQMFTAEYSDWQLGATFSVELGRRRVKAEAQAAALQLARAESLLQQEIHGVSHQVAETTQQIDYAYRRFHEAEQRLRESNVWLQGAKLRYENPNPDAGGGNWLLATLNDYFDALRFRTDSATNAARVLTDYNGELIRLEEVKGTLLGFFEICYDEDPCQQSEHLNRFEEMQSRTPTPLSEPEEVPLPAGPTASQRPPQVNTEWTMKTNWQGPGFARPTPSTPSDSGAATTTSATAPHLPTIVGVTPSVAAPRRQP